MDSTATNNQFIEFFSNNPILNIIFFLLAVLGVFFTVYLFFRGQKTKKPLYSVKTNNLIQENVRKIEALDFYYLKEKIDTLSVSKIIFWNAGKETIDKNDIPVKSKVAINLIGDGKFLDASIIYQKNEINNFELLPISNEGRSIEITFDYFDFNEGVVIQTFSSGDRNDEIVLFGAVKAVGNIKKIDFATPIISRKVHVKLLWGFIILIIVSLISLILSQFFFTEISNILENFFWIVVILGNGLVNLDKLKISKPPKNFDIFNKNF